MNTGKEFERLVYGYYDQLKSTLGHDAEIKLDEQVAGPDGNRQCDITIEHSHLGTKFRTLVECKDYASKVPYLHVDALASKLSDLKFNKGVIVARSGFQRGSLAKAKRLGIDLYSFSEASETVTELNRRLPILHLVLKVSQLAAVFDVMPDFEFPIAGLTSEFSQEMTTSMFLACYIRPDPKLLKGVGSKRIELKQELTLQSQVRRLGTVKISDHLLTNVDVYASFETKAYLGVLNDVNSFYIRRNQDTGHEEAYLPPDAIEKFADELTFLADEGVVPEYLFKGGFVTFSIDQEFELPRQGLFEFEKSRVPFDSTYGGLRSPKGKWLAIYSGKGIYG